MRYKFLLFDRCIFCFKPLPDYDQRKGNGEHIFPKNIFGVWTSHDVCAECKIHFGKKVDVIPKKNIQIINALNEIKINTKSNFSEGLIYKANDKQTQEEIKFYKKDDNLKVKAESFEQKLNLDESDIMTLGLRHVIQNRKEILSLELIEKEYQKLTSEYNIASRGETVYSEPLKMYMRKGIVENIELDIASIKFMSPLIAKITVCAMYYFLFEDLSKFHYLNPLKEHARFEKPLEDWIIRWYPPKKMTYNKYHAIEIDFLDGLCVIDIRFFRSANWRVLMLHEGSLNSKFVYDQGNNKIEIDRMGLVLDFENESDKILYYKYQIKNDEDTHYIRIN